MIQPGIEVLLAGISVLGIAEAALTISPSSHDFGEVPVGGVALQKFETTVPRGTTDASRLEYAFTGPDAGDFDVLQFRVLADYLAANCSFAEPVRCPVDVVFKPRSVGPKRATLVVTHISGARVTAALKGTGVPALCTHAVVPCNYAHHYSGVVSWSGGDGGANVDVVMGVATCNVTNNGGSGPTSGPGLIAVEFDQESDNSTFYRITVACPTRYPPEPARPAELGHDEIGSYKQPLRMTIAQVHEGPPRLKGDNSEGGDVVSWDLCPNSQYRFPIREGDSRRQGRCPPTP